jgi:hypothetical protein
MDRKLDCSIQSIWWSNISEIRRRYCLFSCPILLQEWKFGQLLYGNILLYINIVSPNSTELEINLKLIVVPWWNQLWTNKFCLYNNTLLRWGTSWRIRSWEATKMEPPQRRPQSYASLQKGYSWWCSNRSKAQQLPRGIITILL